MSFEASFQQLVDVAAGAGLQAFCSDLDREWVEQALGRCSSATLRRRKLPTESVVWLVIGMALFRDHSIEDVIRRLELVERGKDGSKGTVVGGAIPQARRRVGEAPLRELFALSARDWGHQHATNNLWRGLCVYAMDGTTVSVQDTDENREAFHLPGTGRGQSGYPKARVVALMAARSHMIIDAKIGPYSGKGNGEPTLALPLWEQVPKNSLLIADRNFIEYGQFYRFANTGTQRHWMVRTKKSIKYEIVEELEAGDEIAEVRIGRNLRREDPSLPPKMRVRIVHYNLDGKPQRLMTSLLDPLLWPASEIIEMYHERWEIELAFDELKTHMQDRRESLRSKSPDGVRQELWGILLAYNLVRHRMALAARKLNIEPRYMSFVYSLRLIRAFLIVTAWDSSPGTIPRHLETLDRELESATLPARRTERRYKRWVKVKMSGYKRNPGRPISRPKDDGAP